MTATQKEFNTIVRLTPLVSIDLIIRNSRGEILLGRRKNEPAKATWFVPGGRIRKEYTDLPAAFAMISKRELEVTLELGDAEFLGVFEHRYPTNAAEEEGYDTYYIVLAYQVGEDLDETMLPTEQHSEWKWFSVDDVIADCDVHQNVKDYCSPLGEIPAAFSGDSPAGPIQYQLVAARRQGRDAMLWQTPALSVAALAFLCTLVLDSGTAPADRIVAGVLALVAACASMHLMTKHRFLEEKDANCLQRFEILHHATRGFRRLHGKQSYHRGLKGFFIGLSAYRVWQCVLGLFALATLVAMVRLNCMPGSVQHNVGVRCAFAPGSYMCDPHPSATEDPTAHRTRHHASR